MLSQNNDSLIKLRELDTNGVRNIVIESIAIRINEINAAGFNIFIDSAIKTEKNSLKGHTIYIWI